MKLSSLRSWVTLSYTEAEVRQEDRSAVLAKVLSSKPPTKCLIWSGLWRSENDMSVSEGCQMGPGHAEWRCCCLSRSLSRSSTCCCASYMDFSSACVSAFVGAAPFFREFDP
eukprot:1887882-Ditylum_brightwellii.AAC.1